jgi:4-hydroxy-4-methyl-2-oxoglutarate aldolase
MPGDAVVGDGDGVVVVQREDVPEVISACRRRAEEESLQRKLFAGGALSADGGSLRGTIERAGFEYI